MIPVARRIAFGMALFVGCSAAACTNSPSAPSAAAVNTSTEVFSGTLTPGTSMFYAINVLEAGTVNLTLASIAGTNGRPALSQVVRIGYGVPQGTGCQVIASANTAPSLSAQLSTNSPAGTFCIVIQDIGNLTQPSTFAVRIVHP